jgi:hypothetical protein
LEHPADFAVTLGCRMQSSMERTKSRALDNLAN